MVLRECAICQSSIYPSEQTHNCEKCGLVFHDECWQENFGCASYGCEMVNALVPKSEEPEPAPLPPPIVEAIEPLPWDFLLLGASALAMVLSSLLAVASPSRLCIFPSVAAALGVGFRVWKTRRYKDPILIAAAALCLIGMLGWYFVSRFLWW
jgi:hypothetical protein